MINIFAILVFLSLNLYVGIAYGQDLNDKREFALGEKNFSHSALVVTLILTIATSGFSIFTLIDRQAYHISDIIPIYGFPFSLLFTARIIVPRMKAFLGNMSIADSLGKLYGNEVRLFTAFTAILSTICLISLQFKLFGVTITYFMGFDFSCSIIITGFIVTIYSSFGGIRSVVFTNLLQITVISIALILAGTLVWQTYMLEQNINFLAAMHAQEISIKKIIENPITEFLKLSTFGIYLSIPVMYPDFYQKILIGKNTEQISKAFELAFWILLIILIYISWLALKLYTLKMNLNLNLNSLTCYLLDSLSIYGVKGIIIAGFLAFAMSSAGILINLCSVIFVHDICGALGITKKEDTIMQLLALRITALLIGTFSIIAAISDNDLSIFIDIAILANSYYIPIVTVPLLCTIFGFRTGKVPILCAMGMGFITVFTWKAFNIQHTPVILATIINFITLMSVHYLSNHPGGWQKISPKKKIPKKTTRKFSNNNLYI